MELTFSRKTITAVIAVLIVLALLGGGYFAWNRGLTNRTSPAPSMSEPAFQAIADTFSPNISAGETTWEKQVCTNMTSDGCTLFKGLYADVLWNAAQSGNVPKAKFTYVNVAEKVSDTSQVWKLSTSDSAQPWLYVQVGQDPVSHKWMLMRVLFDQEAQARYGRP